MRRFLLSILCHLYALQVGGVSQVSSLVFDLRPLGVSAVGCSQALRLIVRYLGYASVCSLVCPRGFSSVVCTLCVSVPWVLSPTLYLE